MYKPSCRATKILLITTILAKRKNPAPDSLITSVWSFYQLSTAICSPQQEKILLQSSSAAISPDKVSPASPSLVLESLAISRACWRAQPPTASLVKRKMIGSDCVVKSQATDWNIGRRFILQKGNQKVAASFPKDRPLGFETHYQAPVSQTRQAEG